MTIADSTVVETSPVDNSSVTTDAGAAVTQSNFSVSFVFKWCAILTGIAGVMTNGVVLAALLSKNLTKQTVNMFIINQVSLDLYSSVLLAISYTMKLFPLPFDGPYGHFLCSVFDSDLITFIGLTGSFVSMVMIAAERYFLIVHPVLHKTQVKRWLIIALGTLPWIEGVTTNIPGVWTSAVVDGVCFKFYFWPSETAQLTYSVCVAILTFIVPLALLVFFYGSILLAVRHRTQVFQGHYVDGDMSTALQATAHRTQMNIISTMIIVSVGFVICWLPSQIFYLFLIVQFNVPNNDTFYSLSVFFIFINVCLNPFIYATKLNPVKKKLRNWISRPKPTLVTIA